MLTEQQQAVLADLIEKEIQRLQQLGATPPYIKTWVDDDEENA